MEEKEFQNKEHLNLNNFQAKDGVLTVVHVEGTEATKYEEASVAISGAIQAPRKFLEVRKDQSAHDRSNVQFSYSTRSIELQTDENIDNKGYTITGTLAPNPKIAYLKINDFKTMYDAKGLAQALRFNRALFEKGAECQKIVEDLMKLKVDVESTIDAAENGRGDKNDSYVVKNKSNVPMFFILKMPIFIGQEPQPFKVDIGYEIRGKIVDLWLESVELQELLDNDAKRIIDVEIAQLPATVLIIEK